MNKIKSLMFVPLFMLLTFTLNVKAETCSYIDKANLLEQATKVTSNYKLEDVKTKIYFTDPDTGEEFEEDGFIQKFVINIYNITKDLYIRIINDASDEDTYISYSNTKEGTYTFETSNLDDIVVYTYEIYSDTDSCNGEVLKTLVFKKPKRNPNAQYGLCEELEDHPLCQKYVTEDVFVDEEVLQQAYRNKIKEEETTKKTEQKEGTVEFFKENYIYIIGGVVVIAAITTTIIIIKRKRSAL